jgi:hypothetical protein
MNEEEIEREEYYFDEDAEFERWRDDCCIDFSEELFVLLKKYFNSENHYMNSVSHLVDGLRSQADYMEKYEKEFVERCKK